MRASELKKIVNAMLILGVSTVGTTMLSLFKHDARSDTQALREAASLQTPASSRQDLIFERQILELKVQLQSAKTAESNMIESTNQIKELREEIRLLHQEIKDQRNVQGNSLVAGVMKAERPPADYAMTFVIGGVDPTNPTFLGYVYDVIASTYIMRKDGSKADVFIFFQISYESAWNTLRDSDIELLRKMDIKFEYIPKHEDESFNYITMEKFRILTLTQYKRVLFMDGDVIARRSLDYLCELSIAGVLKKNVVISGRQEPANAGLFILTPREGAYERIQTLIDEKNERGRQLPYPHWDPVIGWGHQIEPPDYFEKITQVKNNSWDFHCAFSDQGLLYHWVKYEEKSVSIFFNRHIQNWDVDENGQVHLEKLHHLMSTLKEYAKPIECWRGNMQGALCRSPFSDYVHYTGKSKPWLQTIPEGLSDATANQTGSHFWYHSLMEANREHSLGLDFENWQGIGRPRLGMYAKHSSIAKVLEKTA